MKFPSVANLISSLVDQALTQSLFRMIGFTQMSFFLCRQAQFIVIFRVYSLPIIECQSSRLKISHTMAI